ncbi:Cysteine proteinase inhibitor [Linum perenne]
MATLGGVKEAQGSANSLEIDDLARFAVDHHNQKETKEQVVSGTIYHITLEATDGGKKKTYEAKVWVKPWLNFKEVQAFKHVGDA